MGNGRPADRATRKPICRPARLESVFPKATRISEKEKSDSSDEKPKRRSRLGNSSCREVKLDLDLRLYYAYSASGPKGRSEGHGATAVVPSAYFY